MGSHTKIMIIDDSYTNRIFFKATLEELDIEVVESYSAIKALEMIGQERPDLILLDMCMPMMDGLEFLKSFQAKGFVIPVVVVSVLDDQAQIQQALRLGASDYLIKPIETDILVKCISRYIHCEVIL